MWSNKKKYKKAMDLLGKICDPSALPSLYKALNFQDEKVKKQAEKAIKKFEKK